MPQGAKQNSRLVGISDAETVENVSHVLSMIADFIGDHPDESALTPEVRAGVALMLDMAVDALGTVGSLPRGGVGFAAA
jgi:hypothetical protein